MNRDFLSSSHHALGAVRERNPLVGCVTNAVVTNFTANVLLALGASPAMVDIVGEAGPFASVADGLLINLGTPTPEQSAASLESARGASEHGTAWVLDPVAVGFLPVRTRLATELVDLRPTVVRGNASEILAVAGAGAGGRGVDASEGVDAALDAARDLARRAGSVVAISGETDAITDGDAVVRVGGGSAMLTRVTGGGCALGAVVAAFCGVGGDALTATVAAHVTYSAAAEIAVERAQGPGTFAVAFLDALAALAADDLDRIEVTAA